MEIKDIVTILKGIPPVIGAIMPVVVMLKSRPKSLQRDTDQSVLNRPCSPEVWLFARCFLIYAVCGIVSAILGMIPNNTNPSIGLWIGMNVTWVIGNTVIAILIIKHFFWRSA